MSNNSKRVSALRREDSYGVVNDPYGSFKVRRNSLDIDRSVNQISSNQITRNLQETNIYESDESVSVSLNTELSSASYSEIIRAYMGRLFTRERVSLTPAISITQFGNNYSISGFSSTLEMYIGLVIRLDGLLVNSSNKTNLVIVDITSTSVIVKVLNKGNLIPQSNIPSEIIIVGSLTYIPQTEPIKTSFTLENTIDGLSEIYSGLIPESISINSDSSFCNLDIKFVGKRLEETGLSSVFNNPKVFDNSPVNTLECLLLINGEVHYVSNLEIYSSRDILKKTNITSRSVVDFSIGEYTTTCRFNTLLKDWTFSDAMNTEVSIIIVLPVDNTNTSEFVSFVLPSAKVVSVKNSDSSILMTSVEVQAVNKEVAGYINSSFIIQESNTDLWIWDDLNYWDDSKYRYD